MDSHVTDTHHSKYFLSELKVNIFNIYSLLFQIQVPFL